MIIRVEGGGHDNPVRSQHQRQHHTVTISAILTIIITRWGRKKLPVQQAKWLHEPIGQQAGKSGWRSGHQSRFTPIQQMTLLYAGWVAADLNLTLRVFSGHTSFLPPQNRLPLYRATNLSVAFQLAVTCYPIQIKSIIKSIKWTHSNH